MKILTAYQRGLMIGFAIVTIFGFILYLCGCATSPTKEFTQPINSGVAIEELPDNPDVQVITDLSLERKIKFTKRMGFR